MLRITKLNNGISVVIKLEGALREPWITETREALAAARNESSRLDLDLAEVTFIDEFGIGLLRDAIKDGAKILSCSGFVAQSLGMELP
jgi:anti-anti-sigma regulatory factor